MQHDASTSTECALAFPNAMSVRVSAITKVDGEDDTAVQDILSR